MDRLYHGTTSNLYKGILKYGLRAGSFVTDNYKEAMDYANQRAGRLNNMILHKHGVNFENVNLKEMKPENLAWLRAYFVQPVVLELEIPEEHYEPTKTYKIHPLDRIPVQNYRVKRVISIKR